MKKSNKKGFTIVELVIVIAVIAILAAVLIPTFSNLIKRANLSNDQSFVKNMNTILLAEGAIGSIKSAGDAINVLNVNGFDGKYTPFTSGHFYGYHLESNTMYLVDEDGNIVFPKSKDVSAANLWYIWGNNAVDKVPGATKYVSLVSITGNGGYFDDHFAEGTYTLDLGGRVLAYDGEALTNVTVINGKVVAGATLGDGATQMEKATIDTVVAGTADERTVIQDKVFIFTEELRGKVENTKNVTYQNCFFYNWKAEGAGLMGGNVTFDGCTFVDATSYVFNLQGDSDTSYEGTFTVNNCEFINCARVFNIPLYAAGETNPGKIIITNNTFNAVTGSDRSFMQIAFQKNSGEYDANVIGYIDITISGNNFTGIATNQAGIITLHESLVKADSALLKVDKIKFENNTVSSEIPAEKYVVNDDGKPDSAWGENYHAADFKAALADKFVAGKK